MHEIINIDKVLLGYGEKNLLNLDFKIKKGDFIIVTGGNSTGKSLFLKLLYMKVLPKKGNLSFLGKRITANSKDRIVEYRKKIGVILQIDTLIPFFSVYQNIELSSEIQNKKKDFSERIDEILDWLSLAEIKNVVVSQLSTSEKQRVSIARALINNPNLIIADQPDANLDEQTSKKLFFLFDSINKLGTTIIVATNKLNEFQKNYKIVKLD